MSMIFEIGKNDALPKVHATLSADFDANYPVAEQIVYNTGDVIKLYIKKAGTWNKRDVTVEEVIESGKSIRVSSLLLPGDVVAAGDYSCYFRNETIKLTFPIGEYGTIKVHETGNVAS